VSVEQVTVPDIGGAEGAEVIELLVAVGDKVALDQSLIVLESDKASMEIPSTVAGTVVELLVAEGDQLAEGAAIARIDVGADAEDSSAPSNDASDADESSGQDTAVPSSEDNEAPRAAFCKSQTFDDVQTDASQVYAGPAVRKMARELGVRLTQVQGSGPQGRILKEDVQQFVQQAMKEPAVATGAGASVPLVPEIDFSKFGEVDVNPRSKLDKLTAANMQRSWLNVPHVTQFDEADITDLEAFRASLKRETEKRGTKLSPLPFVIKACAVALRDNPKINSSLAEGGEVLVYKKYIHIGMAVDTEVGLMVPVIRNVDRKTIWELAGEIAELAAKARDRKLSPAEMQGGCFTVSSLGNIGGNGFTPIVNTPEVAILGVSKAAVKPVWSGTDFDSRTVLPLALSYDHRVVNGGDGGRFLTQLVSLLTDIRQLSL
jgi:pyruvate dehydrogenase E2 component (dihydrolipoamide acetyltransferase)